MSLPMVSIPMQPPPPLPKLNQSREKRRDITILPSPTVEYTSAPPYVSTLYSSDGYSWDANRNHVVVAGECGHTAQDSIRSSKLLPDDLSGITKHHEDFVKCDDVVVADRVKECMRTQWSNRVVPGQK